MVYTVYIRISLRDRKLYVGCTTDIDKRVKRQNKGKVQATQHRRPLILIHSEDFCDKAAAFNRERFLKSLWGAREKKKILERFLKSRSGEHFALQNVR